MILINITKKYGLKKDQLKAEPVKFVETLNATSPSNSAQAKFVGETEDGREIFDIIYAFSSSRKSEMPDNARQFAIYYADNHGESKLEDLETVVDPQYKEREITTFEFRSNQGKQGVELQQIIETRKIGFYGEVLIEQRIDLIVDPHLAQDLGVFTTKAHNYLSEYKRTTHTHNRNKAIVSIYGNFYGQKIGIMIDAQYNTAPNIGQPWTGFGSNHTYFLRIQK